MSENQMVNPWEGQQISEKIVWPFYRYQALIPKQIGGDLFVWLYFSLAVFVNSSKKRDANYYGDDVRKEVVDILMGKFAAIIDDQTLNRIITNAETTGDFLDRDGKLKEETLSFVSTYQDLFSDSLEVRYIYQDAITGEVVPFFGDSAFLEDQDKGWVDYNEENVLIERKTVKEPLKTSVRNAYRQYKRLKRFSVDNSIAPPEESDDEYVDEDEETFLEPESPIEINNEPKSENEPKSLNSYNVIFLKNSKALFHFNIYLSIQDNKFICRSPFENNTNQWFNRCLAKGVNVSEKLERLISQLSDLYLVKEKCISDYSEQRKNDFASSLNHCKTIYRLLDSLNNDSLREFVARVDQFYGDELCYLYIGKLYEQLISMVQYPLKTAIPQRRNTTYEMFCSEINEKFKYKTINKVDRLQTSDIFNNWQKKYIKKDGTEYSHFKADFTDILLRTELINSKNMYPSFIEDVFHLYDLRSQVAAHVGSTETRLYENDIERFEKTLKVIIELF